MATRHVEAESGVLPVSVTITIFPHRTPMRIPRFIALLLLLAGISGCENSPFMVDGPLTIVVRDRALEVVNRTDEPVYLAVIERESSVLIDWFPCGDPQRCNGLPPGEKRIIPYEEITGYERGEREATLYWWHLEARSGGGFQPDSLRKEIIRL